MQRLLKIAGATVALVLVVIGALQWFASERVEVVVLHTHDASGAAQETRIWVVDHDGSPWLRAGNLDSGWYKRVVADPLIEITRGETRLRYRAEAHPEQRAVINELMHAKYGWGDQFMSVMIGGRDDAVPVRLEPVTR